MTRFRTVSFLLLALTSILAPARAQEAPAQKPSNFAAEQPPVLSLSELVLDQYLVQNVEPGELFGVAFGLVGRSYIVKENGTSKSQASVRLLGRTIVTYDTKEQVQRVRELLTKLDVSTRRDTAWENVEYKPRFISLDSVYSAVKDVVSEYSLVEDRGMILLRGSHANLASVQEILKRIDVPEAQVVLSCQLIDVGGEAHGPALPRELSDNLQRLLPQSTFAQVGMALLKTSVGGKEAIQVELESTGKRCRLSLTPVAFDAASGSLTVTNCRLEEFVEGGVRLLFSTNTVLRGGEYTVLAATGATTRLLVVRVTPQG